MNINYSSEIANAIKSFLKDDDWHFSFDEKRGTFKFGLSIKSKIKKINYTIRVHEDDYTVYAFSPIGVDADDQEILLKMAEFVCRANYGLRTGNFELDVRDGEIRYKTYVDCAGGLMPNKEIIEGSIYSPAAMFDRYALGITEIIFGDISAKEAVAKCEGASEDELQHLLEEMAAEEDGDIQVMIARLAEKLGLSSEEIAELQMQESERVQSGKVKQDIFGTKGGAA